MPSSTSEAERDRVPHFRRPRDLSGVSTQKLEAMVDRLGTAIVALRDKPNVYNIQPLYDGLADAESELIRRLIEHGRRFEAHDVPPPERIIRFPHGRLLGPVGES